MVNFTPENQQKFQNGVFVGSLMTQVWNKAIARCKAKHSPRTLLLWYPPLDPNMGKFKDTTNERAK